jgi:hypothetical protein
MTGTDELHGIPPVAENDLCIAWGASLYACPYGVVKPAYFEFRGAWGII